MNDYLKRTAALFPGLILYLMLISCEREAQVTSLRSFSPEMLRELNELHVKKTYRAGKNSFVLGLETLSLRPAIIGEYGRKCLLDIEGCGSLRHIWETHGPGPSPFILEFYVDGEEVPSIRGAFDELVVAAKTCDQDFSYPGGSTVDFDSYNFYLPVPFEKSLRVELVADPTIGLVFLQLDYRLEDESLKGIRLHQYEDEKGKMKLEYAAEAELHTRKISMPKTSTMSWNFSGDTTLRMEGPGIIRRLAFNTRRKGVQLKIRFDGEEAPAVNVDLADFLGPFRGVVLNNNQCYFPMPFARSAEISIQGSSQLEEWKVEADLEQVVAFREDWRYFHALHTRVDSSVAYLPFQVLSTKGSGHWVGMSVYDTHHDHGGGDFAVIDAGTENPAFLHGINGEDYFSFAFFGSGENFPYSEAFSNEEGRMRVHFENTYPFRESLRLNWGVTGGLSPRSVTYWYQDSPKDLTMSVTEARGRAWKVFGPVTVAALEKDGNTPDVSNLDRLFSILPEEDDLDAGETFEAEHIIFNQEIKANYKGWATQYSSGPWLNMMYIYGHVLPELGGNHHMGYYARAMLAKTEILRKEAGTLKLQISYDDPLQLYLNGEELFSDSTLREGFTTRIIPAQMNKGENTLLIKLLDTPNINTMWAGISLQVL